MNKKHTHTHAHKHTLIQKKMAGGRTRTRSDTGGSSAPMASSTKKKTTSCVPHNSTDATVRKLQYGRYDTDSTIRMLRIRRPSRTGWYVEMLQISQIFCSNSNGSFLFFHPFTTTATHLPREDTNGKMIVARRQRRDNKTQVVSDNCTPRKNFLKWWQRRYIGYGRRKRKQKSLWLPLTGHLTAVVRGVM